MFRSLKIGEQCTANGCTNPSASIRIHSLNNYAHCEGHNRSAWAKNEWDFEFLTDEEFQLWLVKRGL